MARIFAGDLIDFFKDANGAKRDVLEIADRRANQIEATSRNCGVRLGSLRTHGNEFSTRSRGLLGARLQEQCYTLSFD